MSPIHMHIVHIHALVTEVRMGLNHNTIKCPFLIATDYEAPDQPALERMLIWAFIVCHYE